MSGCNWETRQSSTQKAIGRVIRDYKLNSKIKNESVIHLDEIFQASGIAAAEPRTVSEFIKATNKTYITWYFYSRALPFFTDLHSIWYQRVDGKNIKVIPSNIGELLTPHRSCLLDQFIWIL